MSDCYLQFFTTHKLCEIMHRRFGSINNIFSADWLFRFLLWIKIFLFFNCLGFMSLNFMLLRWNLDIFNSLLQRDFSLNFCFILASKKTLVWFYLLSLTRFDLNLLILFFKVITLNFLVILLFLASIINILEIRLRIWYMYSRLNNLVITSLRLAIK